MTTRERLLGIAHRLQLRGEPIPTDILAEAERYGLELSIFNEPTNTINEEGEDTNGDKR